MQQRFLKYLVCVVPFCFLLINCKSQTKEINMPMFKGIRMYMTQKQFNAFGDSLVANDPAFNIVSDGNRRYLEFTEKNDFGGTYNGYVLPTFTNNVITKLTIFYTPSSNPRSVTQYAQGQEQTLMYWGDAVNKVQNDINLKLQIKYGLPVNSGSSVSPHPIVNYTYLFNEWKKDDLSVKLLQEVEKDDGSNRFVFCNYLVEYSPTEEFLKENKKLVEETIRSNSMY